MKCFATLRILKNLWHRKCYGHINRPRLKLKAPKKTNSSEACLKTFSRCCRQAGLSYTYCFYINDFRCPDNTSKFALSSQIPVTHMHQEKHPIRSI